ncbi:N-acetylmuramoyl-L-alanine amidase [Bombilactobacillus bombi]|uniref:N-acetylmuramoyl-L-alanine amidase n=1 Tax=Bombilactobacillus bombi TaxID=1303590 RepID=A0A3R6W953_9LACO|nr:N-acetylmuramoyl-L-alanine amidase [Bombilactobacillus bombi]RHW49771.1 N-acetylmuramoyl-L-alanine amidase [Bombilactobacillus bombi]
MELRRSSIRKKKQQHFAWAAIIVLIACSSVTTFAAAKANQVIVKANFLNVRIGPSLSYETLTRVKRGETLTILSEKNQWYQVRLAGDKIGWVASWLINNDDANTSSNTVGVIKAPNTNVQKYPDNNSEVLGTLPQLQKVNIVYTQNDWSQILYNDTVGWIPNSELIITDKVARKINNNRDQNLNIRSVTTLQNNTKILAEPHTDAKVVAHITDQTTLQYLGKEGDFYKIKLNSGDTGYIASWLVSISNSKHPIKSAATKISEATIVIDPGHGGSDTGALTTNQKHYEKTYTLDTARRLQKQLQQAGANVILTRKGDSDMDLASRARLANKLNADVFISLHFDSTSDKSQATGITTYYYSEKKDQPLAQNIQRQFKHLALPSRGTRFGDFEVTRENEQPAILIEGGYLNNKKDYKQIANPAYRQKLADCILQGLMDYFK